jgi:hypothetical protein
LATRLGCTRPTLAKWDEAQVLHKAGPAYTGLEREVLNILKTEFPILHELEGASSWRTVPVKRLDDFANLVEAAGQSICTDTSSPDAFGVLLDTNHLEPEIRRNSIVVVNPHGTPVNGRLCLGTPRNGGGLAVGIYNRLSGERLKFSITPINESHPAVEYGEKDFWNGPWPIASVYYRT